MTQNIKGPGMLWVMGNINKSPENPLKEDAFLKWYDEDHMREIVATSGIHNAFRCLHVDKASPLGTKECPKPYLAFYPMEDLAFTQGNEFRGIKVKSDLLPGTGIVYDMADMDVGYYGLMSQSGTRKSPSSYLVVSAIEPASDTTEEEVNQFFDQQVELVSRADHYQRSLRFKLLYARTNAQSRALKGLPPTSNEPPPEPPTRMAVHEFSAEPTTNVRDAIRNDSHELLNKAKQNETPAYRIAKVHGKGKSFED